MVKYTVEYRGYYIKIDKTENSIYCFDKNNMLLKKGFYINHGSITTMKKYIDRIINL